jgi:cell division protein FtsX
VLVLVLVAVVVSFAIFFLNGIFTTFRKDMQVKKMLGATKTQIIQPFMCIIMYAIVGGFVWSLLLTVVSLGVFDHYMAQVFDLTLLDYLVQNWLLITKVFVGEIIVIMAILTLISYVFVSRLHKKLR